MPAPLLAWQAAKAVDRHTGGHGKRFVMWGALLGAGALFSTLLVAFAPVVEPARAGSCGPGEAVPSSAELPPSMVAAINALKAEYESAATATNTSWALLAAVDYRENGNDPTRSALSGEKLGTTNPDSGVVTSTKADSLVRAGNHLKAMASSVYGVALTATSPGDDVRKAMIAYNRGSSYKTAGLAPEASPYVMSQFNEARKDMMFPSIPGEPLAGMTDYRFGSAVVFERLGGSSASGCGRSDVELVAVAQGEIGNAEDPDGANRGATIDKYVGSARTALSDPERPWCAMFLSWVHREGGRPFSGGVDGGWNLWGVDGVKAWHRTNGTWIDRDPANPPLPGDSLVTGGGEHIGIVERVDGITAHMISGNSGNRVARTTHRFDSAGDVVGWGR